MQYLTKATSNYRGTHPALAKVLIGASGICAFLGVYSLYKSQSVYMTLNTEKANSQNQFINYPNNKCLILHGINKTFTNGCTEEWRSVEDLFIDSTVSSQEELKEKMDSNVQFLSLESKMIKEDNKRVQYSLVALFHMPLRLLETDIKLKILQSKLLLDLQALCQNWKMEASCKAMLINPGDQFIIIQIWMISQELQVSKIKNKRQLLQQRDSMKQVTQMKEEEKDTQMTVTMLQIIHITRPNRELFNYQLCHGITKTGPKVTWPQVQLAWQQELAYSDRTKSHEQIETNNISFINKSIQDQKKRTIKKMLNQQEKGKKVFTQIDKTTIVNLDTLFKEQNSADCLVMLNWKIDQKWVAKGVSSTKNIILADGGANYFYQSPFRDQSKIRCIIGDFDSVKPDVLQYYKNRDVQICEVQDQNYTDFQKSLTKGQGLGYRHFLCLGILGGRMDHTFSALNVATKFGRKNPDVQIVLVGDGNLIMFLRPNITYKILLNQMISRKACGFITFNKAHKILTTGFKWNLNPEIGLESLQWGQFISTSNQFIENEVSIHSSDQLYFICTLKSDK